MATLMPSVFLRGVLSVLLVLNGCAIRITQPKSPDPTEVEAVKGSGKSIVLIEIDATLDDKPVDSPADFFEFGLANVQSAEPMKPIALFSLVSEGKENGWIYFILEPGTYNFWVMAPRTALKNYRFQFDVSKDSSLIYAGSINIKCWSRGIFGQLAGCTSEPNLHQELRAAKAISQASLRTYGDPSVSMMRPYGTLINLKSLPSLFPMAVSATSEEVLTSPDWENRPGHAWQPNLPSAPVLGPPIFELQNTFSPVALPVFAGLLLVVGTVGGVLAGVQAIGDAQDTRVVKEKWETCQGDLARELSEFDPVGKLRIKLGDDLQKYGAVEIVELKADDNPFTMAQKKGFSTFLHTEIQLVGLRECQRGVFCVHVTGRTRVLEGASGKPLYERAFIYSSSPPVEYESPPFRWAELPFHAYDLPIETRSPCRRIDAYCSEGGHKILREELSKAIEFMAENVLQDLRLQPESTQPVK